MSLLTFSDAARAFATRQASPVEYLEQCISMINAREPVVRAWVALRLEGARKDALASHERYRQGKPLSAIDGLPIGIKDLISTRDLPTGLGIAGHGVMTGDDSAVVQALRSAGAVIVGKAVTTELGGAVPSVTTNPHDPARTPGGSSSGSAAAVAANMVPVAIGTQVGGSILRPAGYCGNFAIKPTMGALHRGERLGLSHACTGVHANSLEDLWTTMVEIGSRSGGDPGYPGLFGSLPVPEPIVPGRLAVMKGPGWIATEPGAKKSFEDFLARCDRGGIALVFPGEHSVLDAFHAMLPKLAEDLITILNWENRPVLANLMASFPEKLHPITIAGYEAGRRLTLDQYRDALKRRAILRDIHAAMSESFDAVISLAGTGAPPLIDDPDRPPHVMPTGNAVYNIVPSMLGAPALNLPMLTLSGMPLGVQLMGQWHSDEQLVAKGRGLMSLLSLAA